jgi:hypothetical protein
MLLPDHLRGVVPPQSHFRLYSSHHHDVCCMCHNEHWPRPHNYTPHFNTNRALLMTSPRVPPSTSNHVSFVQWLTNSVSVISFTVLLHLWSTAIQHKTISYLLRSGEPTHEASTPIHLCADGSMPAFSAPHTSFHGFIHELCR